MNENINDKELWSIVPKKYRNALHRIMDEAQADWLTVYVSGSYLEGFANLTSDLDIFVVHKGQVDKVQNVLFTNSTGAVAQIELTNDSMIDVEHLSEDRLFQELFPMENYNSFIV